METKLEKSRNIKSPTFRGLGDLKMKLRIFFLKLRVFELIWKKKLCSPFSIENSVEKVT